MWPLLLLACRPDPLSVERPPDRAPGARQPITRACDDQDPGRCLLPWPSSAFTRAEPSRATGLAVQVEADSLRLADGSPIGDDPAWLNLADGFSRLSPVLTLVDGEVDPAALAPYPAASTTAPLRVYNVQPDSAAFLAPVPIWTDVYPGSSTVNRRSMLVGFPRAPLEAGAEHMAVLLDELPVEMEASRTTRLIVGLEEPADEDEAALVAYHAPHREALAVLDIDPERVLRLWDFTTRSAEDPTRRLAAMIEQVGAEAGALSYQLSSLSVSSNPDVAAILMGEVTGVPEFRDEDGRIQLDAQGLPIVQGRTTAPFRLVLPSGEGDYRLTLYGHGTGGNVSDNAFDDDFAAHGIAKAGTRFIGWNGDELVMLFASLSTFQLGIEKSSAGLMQSVANTQAILLALQGGLGEALAGETLLDQPNPAAGRRPDLSEPMWMGGSLGGAMGSLISASFPQIHYSVCNVPNGAWSHTIPGSLLYDTALLGVLTNVYGDELDVIHQFAISQLSWDDVDGAAWAEAALAKGTMFLLQQSIDDPIVPNAGTDILALALGASMVGPALQPIPGMAEVEEQREGAGLTQFRVPDTGAYDVHGFAARDTPAGAAAAEQIIDFVQSVWIDGQPRIGFPAGCAEVTPAGDCDFREVWTE